MTESWQTIEQAAVSLRLSVRTINRHIAAGKLQSRLQDGRREVLVTTAPVGASLATESPADAYEAATTPPSHSSVDAETVLALADNAAEKAEMAVSAYQALARVSDTQVRQLRRGARLAWTAVALMAVGVTVAVGWTTQRLTRTTGRIAQLDAALAGANDTSRQLSVKYDALAGERAASEQAIRAELSARQDALRAEHAAAEKALRAELASARDQAARAEGALAGYREIASLAREPSDAASDASTDDEQAESAVLAKSVVPSTRPAALRRKAKSVTTRPAPSSETSSDTSSASTAEER